jgi:hypothetical protein
MKFKRKILSLVMAVCMLSVCSVSTGAQIPDLTTVVVYDGGGLVTPFFAYTSSTATTLSISNSGVATAGARLTGYPGITTQVRITMTLQKRGFLGLTWSDEVTWSQTFNSHSGTLSRQHNVGSGTYRVKAVYVAFSGNNSETITSYSGTVSY